jgi:hypothetical protein
MATFVRETRQEAESTLRDFPNNWERIESRPRAHYRKFRCKDDPNVVAVIQKDGFWFVDIFEQD